MEFQVQRASGVMCTRC